MSYWTCVYVCCVSVDVYVCVSVCACMCVYVCMCVCVCVQEVSLGTILRLTFTGERRIRLGKGRS